MNLRVASVFFVVAFGFATLPARAQGPGGPPPNYQQLVSQLNALSAQVTALQGRVSTLEGNITSADLAGTYTIMALSTNMTAFHPGTPPINATISTAAFRGTLVLNADGTGSLPSGTCEGSTLVQGSWSMHGVDCTEDPTTVSWVYANGVITITFANDADEIPFAVALGGRLLITAFAPFHPSDPSSDQAMLIATRLK